MPMQEAPGPASAPAPSARATDWWDDFGKELVPIFERALYVANDVLAFDAHRVFVENTGSDQQLEWQFPKGIKSGTFPDQDKHLAALKNVDPPPTTMPQLDPERRKLVVEEPARGVAAPPEPQNGRYYCQALFELPIYEPACPERPSAARRELKSVIGFLSISRREGGGYSEIEAHHLKQVATLIEDEYRTVATASTDEDRARGGVLNRLRLNLDYRRKFLQTANKDEVTREFLMKTVRVIHPDCKSDALGTNQRPPTAHCDDAIHPVVKLLETSGTQLSLDGWLSTRPELWAQPMRDGLLPEQAMYALGKQPGPKSTIAALVYWSQMWALCTNEYSNWPTSVRLFLATKCHLAAPIVDCNGGRLGVLSVETDNAHFQYTPAHVAALTLLAASMHAPLTRALGRLDLSTVTRVLSDKLVKLTHEPDLPPYYQQLEETLKTTYWVKICPRDENELPRPAEPVKSKPVVSVPETAAAVATEPPTTGGFFNPALKTYDVFDVPDAHGMTLWTTKFQHRDRPLTDADRGAIAKFSRRLTDCYEYCRLAEFERVWDQKVMGLGFAHFNDVLRTFGKLVCDPRAGIVRRCRVFELTKEGAFALDFNLQFGPDQVGQEKRDSLAAQNDASDLDILDKKIRCPVLFRLAGAPSPGPTPPKKTLPAEHTVRSSSAANDPDETEANDPDETEFKLLVGTDTHGPNYNNGDRMYWVEFKVEHKKKTYKIVLDHKSAPNDVFTLGEMLLIASLARSLTAALRLTEAYNAISLIAIGGLHESLLTHYFQKLPGNIRSGLRSLVGMLQLHEGCQDVLKTCQDMTTLLDVLGKYAPQDKKDGDIVENLPAGQAPNRVSDVVEHAVEACRLMVRQRAPWLTLTQNDTPPALQLCRIKSPRSLFILLITLIDNAFDAVRAKRRAAPPPSPNDDRVLVVATKGDGAITIEVRDNGIALNEETSEDLKNKFRSPDEFLARFTSDEERGLGLILASFLAKRWGWTLTVDQVDEGGTLWKVFRVTLPAPGPGSGDVKVAPPRDAPEGNPPMSPIEPRTDIVWFCEDQKRDRERFGPKLDNVLGSGITARRINSTEAAYEALDEAARTGAYPWLVLSDTVFTVAKPGHQSPAAVLRAKSCLSMTYLFSGSAYSEPNKLAALLFEMLVARARPKYEEPEMLADIGSYRQRWNLPEIVRFRRHVLAAGEHANRPYFPRGDGGHLSLNDLHREMVLGTRIGLEQMRIWDAILRDDLASLGIRPRPTDNFGHVEDTEGMRAELAGHIVTVPVTHTDEGP